MCGSQETTWSQFSYLLIYGVPVINLRRQAWQQSTFPSLAISPTPPCILLVSIYSYMIIFDNSEMIVYLWYSVLSVGNTKADKMG